MTKKQVITALMLSTMVLAGARAVLADEVAPVDPSTPILTVPAVPTPVEPTQPTEPSTPVAPTTPTEPTTPSVDPVQPTEPSQPTTPVTPTDPSQPVTPTEPSKPAEESTKPGLPEQPKEESKTPEQKEEASKDDKKEEVKKDEDKQPVTSPPAITIPDVSPSKPVITNKGHEIIGTQDSQVIIRTPEGITQTVAPEVVGAKKNSDGTVSVKTKEGKMETLPSTGEEASILTTLAGFGLLAGLAFWKKKETSN